MATSPDFGQAHRACSVVTVVLWEQTLPLCDPCSILHTILLDFRLRAVFHVLHVYLLLEIGWFILVYIYHIRAQINMGFLQLTDLKFSK